MLIAVYKHFLFERERNKSNTHTKIEWIFVDHLYRNLSQSKSYISCVPCSIHSLMAFVNLSITKLLLRYCSLWNVIIARSSQSVFYSRKEQKNRQHEECFCHGWDIKWQPFDQIVFELHISLTLGINHIFEQLKRIADAPWARQFFIGMNKKQNNQQTIRLQYTSKCSLGNQKAVNVSPIYSRHRGFFFK